MQTTRLTATSISSDLALFLKSLTEAGHAVVGGKPLADEADDAVTVLRELDDLARNELALDAPKFSADTALWAARLSYHLCQFTVCRDIGEERIAAVCQTPCPSPRGPETDWSADLTLRHLPKLFQLAHHLSNADPLVAQMKEIASTWPLSSAGITGLGGLDTSSFIGHPALRRLYADRIIASSDISRLGDTRLDELLRVDLGIYRDLAPAIATRIFTTHDTD